MAGTRMVVALGGNAISQPHEEGNVDQQFANSRETAKALATLIEAGHQLIVTHGNGPQIGNFLLRNEAAADKIYPLAMEVAVAHVQGGMGFMIAQTLMNELAFRGTERRVTTVISTVEVDPKDPSFVEPTKPVGRVFDQTEAARYREGEGWTMREIQPGKFRRVVPSPVPKHVVEIDTIRQLVEAGELVVVVGGGGIPVIRDSEQGYRGTAAVIDKDLASALVGNELDADAMMILTAIDRVRLNFGKPDERPLDRLTVSEAERYLAEGQFPPGSMGPKVQGAINFLKAAKADDARVVIGPLHEALDAIDGRTGTTIVKG
jgi:carbamate kinase